MASGCWSRLFTTVFGTLMILLSCSCMALLTRPHRVTVEDFYQWEARHYPNSGWRYLGKRGRFHYFSPVGARDSGSISITLSDWKLPEKYLQGVTGFSYDPETRTSRSVDVEVHRKHIRIHIDGENPEEIPFESLGFITADHRPIRHQGSREESHIPLSERIREGATDSGRVRVTIPNSGAISVP